MFWYCEYDKKRKLDLLDQLLCVTDVTSLQMLQRTDVHTCIWIYPRSCVYFCLYRSWSIWSDGCVRWRPASCLWDVFIDGLYLSCIWTVAEQFSFLRKERARWWIEGSRWHHVCVSTNAAVTICRGTWTSIVIKAVSHHWSYWKLVFCQSVVLGCAPSCCSTGSLLKSKTPLSSSLKLFHQDRVFIC